jgi:hypothetical protein
MPVAPVTLSLKQKQNDTPISISKAIIILFKSCELLITKRLIFHFPNQIEANFDFT